VAKRIGPNGSVRQPTVRVKRNRLDWRFQLVSPFWFAPSSPSTWQPKVWVSPSYPLARFKKI